MEQLRLKQIEDKLDTAVEALAAITKYLETITEYLRGEE